MKLLYFIVIVGLSSIFVACGNAGNNSTTRDYRVFVKSSEPEVQNQFKMLVQDFNQSVGLQVLQFETSAEEATSPIALIAGLQRTTGKLGYGGVLYHVNRSGLMRERTAAMQIELDMAYVRSRLPSSKGTVAYDDLRLLFFHEVGHGLGFGHATDLSDVMYSDLNGSKDYLTFYQQVRAIYD